MAEEIKQRITIEADEAIARLKAVTGLEFELAKKVEGAGEAAKAGAEGTNMLAGSLRSLGTALTGGLTLAGAFAMGLREMAKEAKDALAATVELGRQVKGLAANTGAPVATSMVSEVNRLAIQMGFNKSGRNQLLGAVSRYADLKPGADVDDLKRFAGAAAMLQRAVPDASGKAAADMLFTLNKAGGLAGPERAAEFAAMAVSSGFDPGAIQQMTQRFGPMGGLELVSLLVAAKGEGLVGDSQRQVQGFLGSLDQRDERGRLTRPLRAAGITDKMSIPDRMKALFTARRSGALSEGQFLAAIGGVQNLQFVAPLEAALGKKDYLRTARAAEVGSGRWGTQMVAAVLGSELIRMEEAAGRAELRPTLFAEGSTEAATAELVRQEMLQDSRESGSGSVRRWAQGAVFDVSRFLGSEGDSAAVWTDRLLGDFSGRRAVVNIQTQINTGVNPHTDVRPPEVP
jgi:hypothetical protein